MAYSATISAPPAAAYGLFGASVAVGSTGRTTLVGAPNSSSYAGSAFAVAFSGGEWGAPEELPVSSSPGDGAGTSVALSGRSAAVGSPGTSSGRGAVLLFDQDFQGDWELAATLTTSDTPPVSVGGLGATLAWSGDAAVLVAGAPESSVNGAAGAGAGVVFMSDPDGGAFVVAGILSFGAAASGSGAFDALAVSYGGTAIAAGARSASGGAGAASIFTMHLQDDEINGSDDPPDVDWTEAVLGLPPGPEPTTAAFGASVALSGDGLTAAVGAPAPAGPGAVYIFTQEEDKLPHPHPHLSPHRSKRGDAVRRLRSARPSPPDNVTWTFTAMISSPAGPAAGDGFGASVALSFDGSELVVGAVPSSGGPGAAYAFAAPGNNGNHQAWIPVGPAWASPQPQSAEDFGQSLSCAGGACVVGTSNAPGGTPVETGYAYVWATAQGASAQQTAA